MNLIKKIQDWFKRRKFNKNKDSFRFVVVYPEDVDGFKNKMVFDSCVVCGHPKFKLTTLNEDLKGLVCSNCNNTIVFYSLGLQRGSEGHSEIKLLGANRYRKTVVKTPIPTENKHTSNGVRDDTWLKRKLSEPVNHEVDLLNVWCSSQAKDDHVDMTIPSVTPSGGKVNIKHVKKRPIGRGCGLSFMVLDDFVYVAGEPERIDIDEFFYCGEQLTFEPTAISKIEKSLFVSQINDNGVSTDDYNSRKNNHHEKLEWVPHSENTKYTEDISEDNNVKR